MPPRRDYGQIVPVHPSPSREHLRAPPLDGRRGRLDALAARFISRLGSEDITNLQRFIEADLRGVLSVCTHCSGTDSPLLALEALSAAIRNHCGTEMRMEHAYSCEKTASKRKFIRKVWPGALVFNDVADLRLGSARTDQGVTMNVPASDVCVAGFPCTDASMLNNSAHTIENRTCVRSRGGATGSVFHNIIDWLGKDDVLSKLRMLTLENVPSLAYLGPKQTRSNLDEVSSLVRDRLRMMLMVWLLSPKDFGMCQARPRLWMGGVPLSALESAGISEDDARHMMAKWMDLLSGSEMTPLDEVLLEDDNVLVVRSLGATRAVKRRKVTWPVRHEKAYHARGMDWTQALTFEEATVRRHPGLGRLSQREIEIIELNGVTEFPEREPRIVETSQSLGRYLKPMHGHCGTVFPKARLYLTHRCRLVAPAEMLRLQGIDVPREILLSTPDNVIANLAGNAFDTGCCMATMLVTCLLLSHCSSRRAASVPTSLSVDEQADHDDSDDNDDDDAFFEMAWGKRA